VLTAAKSSPGQQTADELVHLRHLSLCSAQHVVDLVVCALQVAGAANTCQVGAPPGIAAQEGGHLIAKATGTAAHC